MEVEIDEGAVGPPPSSPVSRDDDDLLSGNMAAGVEAGLAHLTISSPSGQEVEGEEASHVEAPPLQRKSNCRTDGRSLVASQPSDM